MKRFLIIQLILYFGWLSCIAVAQIEVISALTDSSSFARVVIICLGNLAVFITGCLRERLDLEMAARDFLATITGPCKFKEITGPCKFKEITDPCKFKEMQEITEREQKGKVPDEETGACRFKENNKHELIAVTPQYPLEASVVILSNSAGMTNSCIGQFMQYIYNAHNVHSILLKYKVLKDPNASDIHCEGHRCNCIVINDVEEINMPQVPKEGTNTQCLLPSLKCLENGCHGCNPHLLHVEENMDKLNVEFSSAVCDAVDFEFTTPTQKEPICICVPVNDDKWTKLLVRFLKYKDQEDKGAVVAAADALQSYLDNGGKDRAEEIGDKTVSLIVIRLVEIFVNLLLTVFFKVDGFSSALAARRAVRSYVVDSKGNGLPANVFLTSGLVVVKSDSVCQVLKFRGNRFFLLMLLSTCFVNLLCAIAWAVVLIAFNGGIGKWYAVPSMAPSKPRVAVIIAAICIGIVMDCFELSSKRTLKEFWIIKKKENQKTSMILGVIILEIVFAVVVGLGVNKGIGRWVYGALQLLVWVKWGIGSSILGAYCPDSVSTSSKRGMGVHGRVILEYTSATWVDQVTLVYSSSFLLNAVMVGVMADWSGFWST